MKKSAAIVAMAGLCLSGMASATVYSYSVDNPSGSTGAGDITRFSATYDDVSENLSWSTTIREQNGFLADGFWLVLSDGENPKNDVNEYAILYGDIASGNISAYAYNGVNSASSWQTPGDHIETLVGILSVDDSVANQRTFGFSLDGTNINAHDPDNSLVATDDWDGVSFGPKIGIWFHAVVFDGLGAAYDLQNKLTSFDYSRQSWYDTSMKDTSVVPVPAAVWLFGSALLGLAGFSRRRKTT